jgi:hypothetical protein
MDNKITSFTLDKCQAGKWYEVITGEPFVKNGSTIFYDNVTENNIHLTGEGIFGEIGVVIPKSYAKDIILIDLVL